jgi:Cof subfamily protein (haloacid dehalogenase superfamily)
MLPALVFCDMDGTFLASDKSIPAENFALLDEVVEWGVSFVPCTGRPLFAVPEAIRAHPAVTYAISANGAIVSDVRQGVRLHEERIDTDAALALYERVCHLDVTFDVFVGDLVLSERARYDRMGDLGLDEATLKMLRLVRTPVDLTVPEILARYGKPEKITCFWGDERVRDALAEAMSKTEGATFAKGHPNDFELQARGVSKGRALIWLCDHLGIEVARSVAFGDEGNDEQLLRAAGDGVAMANATPEVLAAADHVCEPNDDCGVARYLHRIFGRA